MSTASINGLLKRPLRVRDVLGLNPGGSVLPMTYENGTSCFLAASLLGFPPALRGRWRQSVKTVASIIVLGVAVLTGTNVGGGSPKNDRSLSGRHGGTGAGEEGYEDGLAALRRPLWLSSFLIGHCILRILFVRSAMTYFGFRNLLSANTLRGRRLIH